MTPSQSPLDKKYTIRQYVQIVLLLLTGGTSGVGLYKQEDTKYEILKLQMMMENNAKELQEHKQVHFIDQNKNDGQFKELAARMEAINARVYLHTKNIQND